MEDCGFDFDSMAENVKSKVFRYLDDGIYFATRDLYKIMKRLESSQWCDDKWDGWSASTSREWGSWDENT